MSNAVEAYVCMGSNSIDSATALDEAVEELAVRQGVRILALSGRYLTEPQGLRDQPWFLNQAIKLQLSEKWRSREFLRELLAIEKKLGRIRSSDPSLRFGPRRIDLDLLLFGRESSREPDCVLPHPRMLQRAFVLYPLKEIGPELIVEGHDLSFWLEQLSWKIERNCIYQIETSGVDND